MLVGVDVGVSVGVLVMVWVCVGVIVVVNVGVGVLVLVGVTVGVLVMVGVFVTVGVFVDVGVIVGVDVGLGGSYSSAPMSTISEPLSSPSIVLWSPSKSVAGIEGAALWPTSMQGEPAGK